MCVIFTGSVRGYRPPGWTSLALLSLKTTDGLSMDHGLNYVVHHLSNGVTLAFIPPGRIWADHGGDPQYVLELAESMH